MTTSLRYIKNSPEDSSCNFIIGNVFVVFRCVCFTELSITPHKLPLMDIANYLSTFFFTLSLSTNSASGFFDHRVIMNILNMYLPFKKSTILTQLNTHWKKHKLRGIVQSIMSLLVTEKIHDSMWVHALKFVYHFHLLDCEIWKVLIKRISSSASGDGVVSCSH